MAGADAIVAVVVMTAGGAVVVGVAVIGAHLPAVNRNRLRLIPTTEIDESIARQYPLGDEPKEKEKDEYASCAAHNSGIYKLS